MNELGALAANGGPKAHKAGGKKSGKKTPLLSQHKVPLDDEIIPELDTNSPSAIGDIRAGHFVLLQRYVFYRTLEIHECGTIYSPRRSACIPPAARIIPGTTY